MKRAIRKANTRFWVFHFWDLVPIDSALNSASGNLTKFFQKCKPCTKKSMQTWKSRSNLSETSFVIGSSKTGKCWKQNVFTGSVPGVAWVKKDMSKFDSDSLICRPALLSSKIVQIMHKVIVFSPKKRKGDRALILAYLDSPRSEVLPHHSSPFLIWAILRGKREVKVGPKVQNVGLPIFYENTNPSKCFKQRFCFLTYYLW